MCRCRLLPGKCVTCTEMGLRGMFGVWMGAIRAHGNRTFDSQVGTGEEGCSHSCTKGYYPK